MDSILFCYLTGNLNHFFNEYISLEAYPIVCWLTLPRNCICFNPNYELFWCGHNELPPHSNIIQEPPLLLGLKQHKIMILTKGKSFWQTWTVKCILVATISCLIRDASDRFSILKWKVSSKVSTNTIQIIDGKGKHEGMKMSAVEFKAKF